MRAVLGAMLILGATAQGALAQGWSDVPDGVQRYDGAALRQRILADQAGCRDQVRALAEQQVIGTSGATSGAAALSTLAVEGGRAAPVIVNHQIDRVLDQCMGARGYVARAPAPEDVAAYRAAVAAGAVRDPYARVVGYEMASSPVTSMVEDRDTSGRLVRTYTVGRF